MNDLLNAMGQHNQSLSRPNVEEWRNWSWDEYLAYFLSYSAVRMRLHGEPSLASVLSDKDLRSFCEPIRQRLALKYNSASPIVSIQISAYNEELELLPTLVSYTCLMVDPGVAEIIVADNLSDDRTPRILEYCGVNSVRCGPKGLPFGRKAAYDRGFADSRYTWITDADTRVIAPFASHASLRSESTVLRTNVRHLDMHPEVLGVSTGAVVDAVHWSYRFLYRFVRRHGGATRVRSWCGCNHFIRTEALRSIGGIDTTIDRHEDRHRFWQLVRLAKRSGRRLSSAENNPEVVDPVYYSGRRFGTLMLVARHAITGYGRRQRLVLDEDGFPIFPKNESWGQVRRG